MTPAQIPDTPTEPPTLIETDESTGKETVIMEVGKEIEDIAGQPISSNGDAPMPGAPAASVGQLLNQLAASGNQPFGFGQDANAGATPFGGQPNLQGFGLDPNLLQMMQNLPPEQLQALVGQNVFSPNHSAQPPPPMYNPSMGSGDGDEPWTGPLYGGGGGSGGEWDGERKNWDGEGFGRGGFKGQGRGRGGGRPVRRVPCHFFAQGRHVRFIKENTCDENAH